MIILLTWTHVIILHRHLRELVIRQQRDNQLYVTTDSWKFPARTNDLILLKDRGRASGQQINHVKIFTLRFLRWDLLNYKLLFRKKKIYKFLLFDLIFLHLFVELFF